MSLCRISGFFRRCGRKAWVGSSQLRWKLARHVSSRRKSSPLLPDYLNTVKASLKEQQLLEKIPEAEGFEGLTRSAESQQRKVESQLPAAKERSVVAIALKPSEALSPPKEIPEVREPLPSHLARMGPPEVMKILSRLAFNEGYQSEEIQKASPKNAAAAESQASSEAPEEKGKSPRRWDYRQLRLQVKPEHRHNIRVMMCKKIVHDCLETLRRLQGQNEHEEPLWWFERRAVKKLVGSGSDHGHTADVEALVKFLARKHLHIQHGAIRGKCIPGTVDVEPQREMLNKEWFQFSRTTLNGRVTEDLLLRKFLDHEVSWDIILRMLEIK